MSDEAKPAAPAEAKKVAEAPAANGAAGGANGAAAAALPAAATPVAATPAATTPGDAPKSAGGGKFKENFRAFSKFGDTKSDGKMITLSQSDKWMKQAGVIDKSKLTTTDTGIHFKKFKALKVNVQDYEKFIGELARARKMEVTDIKNKMSECGAPGHTGSSASSKVPNAVDRLTDVTRYTGSHKQRFDDTGKGRGLAGRKDVPDATGYVQGYQNKDSYSKMH